MSWTGSGRASAFTSDAAALANLIFLFVIFGLLSIIFLVAQTMTFGFFDVLDCQVNSLVPYIRISRGSLCRRGHFIHSSKRGMQN